MNNNEEQIKYLNNPLALLTHIIRKIYNLYCYKKVVILCSQMEDFP